MSSRRSFLAWLPAFLGGVATVPRLAPDSNPERQTRLLERTIGPGVYLVGDDIPGLDVESGDHIIVRDTHAALHRYLDHEMLVILKDYGDLTWVKDLDPRQTVWRPDGCYEMVGPFVGQRAGTP